MKLLLSVILVCNGITTVGQIVEPMTIYSEKIRKNQLQQRIKSQKMYQYIVDASGNVAKEGELRNFEQYDQKGHILRQETHIGNNDYISEYQYDEKGNLIKSINSQNGDITGTQIHTYDENNKEISTQSFDAMGKESLTQLTNKKEGDYTIMYDKDGKINFKSYDSYDSKKRVYISRLLSPRNKIYYENKYILDNNEAILEWYIVDDLQKRRLITIFKYDEKGNRIEEIGYKIPKKQVQKILHFYDNDNLIIQDKLFDENNKLIQITKYEYEKHSN